MKFRKTIALLLTLSMLLGIPAMAVNVSGQNTAVDGQANSVVTVDAEPVQMTVTVPAVLPATVNSRGKVTVATDAKVINRSYGPVAVTTIKAEPVSPWQLVGLGYDFSSARVNSKLVQVSIEGQTAGTDGNVPMTADWIIQGGNTAYPFSYGIRIPAQRTALTDASLSNVVFTIDWLKSEPIEAGIEWEYIIDGDTLTLTKYIGESNEIVVHNQYTVDEVTYEKVALGTSYYDDGLDMIFGPFTSSAKVADITYIGFESGIILPPIFESMFDGCESLVKIEGIGNWDVSHVTSMNAMFYNCKSLKSLDISRWNVGQVTDMSLMFRGCSSLIAVDVSQWDTSNATSFSGMFYKCPSLQSVGDLGNWNTGKVTIFNNMFRKCSALQNVGDLSNWDTGSGVRFHSMFCNCSSLQSVGDLSNWDTSSATSMENMFAYCENLHHIGDLSNWDMSNVESIRLMFVKCPVTTLGNLGKWDTSSVTSMCGVFNMCANLRDTGDLGNWDTGKVTDMSYAFAGAEALELVGNLGNWNTSEVKNMNCMFKSCTALNNLDLSRWDVGKVMDMTNMFASCFQFTNLDLSAWNIQSTTTVTDMLKNCARLTTVYVKDNITQSKLQSAALAPSGCAIIIK